MIYAKNGTPLGAALALALLTGVTNRRRQPHREKYNGATLRAIRARNGVGRPPGTVPERETPPMREAA
jgi:hypothetical protein